MTHITLDFFSVNRCVYKVENLAHTTFKAEITIAAHLFSY